MAAHYTGAACFSGRTGMAATRATPARGACASRAVRWADLLRAGGCRGAGAPVFATRACAQQASRPWSDANCVGRHRARRARPPIGDRQPTPPIAAEARVAAPAAARSEQLARGLLSRAFRRKTASAPGPATPPLVAFARCQPGRFVLRAPAGGGASLREHAARDACEVERARRAEQILGCGRLARRAQRQVRIRHHAQQGAGRGGAERVGDLAGC